MLIVEKELGEFILYVINQEDNSNKYSMIFISLFSKLQ